MERISSYKELVVWNKATELEFYIAHQLEYVSTENYQELQVKAGEIGRMLNGLAKKLEAKLVTGHRPLVTTNGD